MDWNVKNAVNRDVERQHLNKILKEIRGAVDELGASVAAEGGLEDDVRQVVAGLVENNTEHGITVIYNSDGEVLDFIVNDFTIRLSGDVTGEADVVGLRDVNITATIDPALIGIPEAPIDGYPYWRYGGEWQQVTGGLYQLEELITNGFAVKVYDSGSGEHSWIMRQMEVDSGELTVINPDGVLGNPSLGLADVVPGPAGVLTAIETDQFGRVAEQHPVVVTGTAGEIVVADGDAALGNPTISLADVVPTAGGTLQKTTFDTKGRRTQEDTADTDDLPEGVVNLYFTASRVRATVLDGLSTATNAVITAADTVLSALGKLQAQISAIVTNYVTTARTISTTAPLTGGGDLSTDRTIAISAATTGAAGSMSAADKTKLDGIESGATATIDSIADGDTTHPPSRNAVFDALATKLDSSAVSAFMLTVLDDTSATAARTTLGIDFSGALVSLSASQSIPTSVATAITFGAETYDTDSYHDNVTNPSRITIPSDGVYLATANITFNTNTTGIRQVEILKNGSGYAGMANLRSAPIAGFPLILNISTGPLSLVAGDYLEVFVFQSSGAALSVLASNTSSFSIYRVSPDTP